MLRRGSGLSRRPNLAVGKRDRLIHSAHVHSHGRRGRVRRHLNLHRASVVCTRQHHGGFAVLLPDHLSWRRRPWGQPGLWHSANCTVSARTGIEACTFARSKRPSSSKDSALNPRGGRHIGGNPSQLTSRGIARGSIDAGRGHDTYVDRRTSKLEDQTTSTTSARRRPQPGTSRGRSRPIKRSGIASDLISNCVSSSNRPSYMRWPTVSSFSVRRMTLPARHGSRRRAGD